MKTLTMLLLGLLALPASAETVAWTYNKGGQRIVLTDEACPKSESGKIVYTSSKGGSALMGCWWWNDPDVVVKWSDGDIYVYPSDSFTLNPNYSKGKTTY